MTENDQNEALSLPEILKAQLFKGPRQPLRSAYLLFAEALLPLLARYLHRQQIRFKVSAPLNLQKNGPKRVIFLCPDLAESKKNLPRFVLTYLQDLPRCRLFYQLSPATDSNDETTKENRGFLVEYGFQHPLPATEIDHHFRAKILYFTFGDRQHPALVIDPAPFLSNDCDLSKPESCIGLSHRSLDSTATSAQLPFLRLELHLTSDPHALEPTRALYLEGKEIKWFAALWQRLPGPLLARLRWAGDREHGILLLPEDEDISLFPFAEPLKKVKNNLFLPLKQRLSPQLTSPQLENTLALVPEKLTFFTSQWRFDIAKEHFQALDKAIIASMPTSTTLKFSNPDEAFDFVWQNRNEVCKGCEPSSRESTKSRTEETPEEQKPSPLTITKSKESPDRDRISQGKNSNTPTEILKEYALLLRRQNDFIGAATCFSLAEEPLPAAECYRLAALSLEQ